MICMCNGQAGAATVQSHLALTSITDAAANFSAFVTRDEQRTVLQCHLLCSAQLPSFAT
jgi:hypothetical protein